MVLAERVLTCRPFSLGHLLHRHRSDYCLGLSLGLGLHLCYLVGGGVDFDFIHLLFHSFSFVVSRS